MKTFVKSGLLTSTLMAIASSAFAVGGQTFQTISTTNSVYTVPGPVGLGLLGIGIVVLALVRRKK